MARTFAALVIDSDLKGLEALVYGFQGADWRITACPAPDTAAFLVKASAADVVVMASREPHDKAMALVRQLRSQDHTRTLPLLVLGPASLRARVLENGAVDFLPTPVFVRDAIMASRISIATARDPEPKIEGNLTEFSVLSLLRSMSALGRSGVLQIERAGRRGEVLFSEGELTGAQLGALQGSAALHHLLMWEDGKISLGLRAVGRRAPINQRFDQVIEEAERFLRDYLHAIAGLGCSSTIYDKNEAKLSGSAQSLPSEVMPIIRLCDGQRTLADLIDQSPFRVFDTIRIVVRLVDMGALTRRQGSGGVSQPAQDLQKFWETARIASPDDKQTLAQPVNRGSTSEARVGEPNRRKLQRRARAETPVLGTPLTELVEAKPPSSQSAATMQPLPSDASKGKERTSGVLQIPTSERRQSKNDRRERPSVTIDLDLVEAAMMAPTPPPVVEATAAAMSAKPAPTPATGRPVMSPAAKPALTPAAGAPVASPAKPALTPAMGRPVMSPAAKPALTPAAGAPVVSPAKPALTPAMGRPVMSPAAKPALTPAAGAPVVSPAKPALTPAMGRPVMSPAAKPALTPAAGAPVVSPAKSALTPAMGRPVMSPAAKPALTPAAGAPMVSPAKPALTPAAGRPVVSPAAKPALTPAAGAPVVGPAKPTLTPATGRPVTTTLSGQEPVSSPASAPAPGAQSAAEASAPRKGRITGTLLVASSSATRRTGQVPLAGASVSVDPTLASEASKTAAPVAGQPAAPLSTSPSAPSQNASTHQPAPQGEAARGARVTGTLSISPSQRTSLPKAPGKDVSVRLDPVLVAELDRLEKATIPVGPPSASEAPTAPIKTSGNRITGTLSISSLPRSNKSHKTPGPAGISVALDPSLVQETQKTIGTSAEASTGKEPAISEKGTAGNQPAQPMAAEGEGSRTGSRISGAFNAVESDFFAREADLYKREGDDNFSDLDEPAGRAGSKNTSRRQNRR